MSSFADLWNSAAQEPKKIFASEDLPEGDYVFEVINVKLGPTQKGDKDMVSWDLKVVDSTFNKGYINRRLFVNRAFSKTDMSEQNIKALERALNDFKQLDLPCGTNEIGNTMKSLIGKHVKINIKNSNNGSQFYNFRQIVPIVSNVESFGSNVFPDEEIPF